MSDQNRVIGQLTNIAALTVEVTEDGEPVKAVQYAVVSPDGERVAYGDQRWVMSGRALDDAPAGSRVEFRTISLSYGEWQRGVEVVSRPD